PRRRFDHELLIDPVLVTLTAGALAYEFLLKPLFDLSGNVPSLLTSIGWSVGGIGVLWLILVELLRHTRVPLAAAGVVTALGVLCVTNVLYAAAALRRTFRSGGVLDLGWAAGLLLLAATASAERNLRLVMDAVPDAIVVVDREGRILESNRPTRVMGALTGPAENRNIFEFLATDAAAVVREKLAATFHGEIQRFEIPFSRDDATHGVAAALYAPIREGSGITRVLILARDITEQKRSESQFQQAEKLAAMGQLVSGVAH